MYALCALLHQLFSQKPSLIEHAMTQFREDGQGLINSTESLWKVLRNAIRDPQTGPVILVLDALDECAESEFADLVRNVESQFRSDHLGYGKLKYLLTCGPYDQIVSKFRGLLEAFPYIRIPGEEVEFLGGLPLAIKQASDFMAQTRFSTPQYLEQCQASDEHISPRQVHFQDQNIGPEETDLQSAKEVSAWNSDSCSSSSNTSMGLSLHITDAASTAPTEISIVASNMDVAITAFVDLVFSSSDVEEALEAALGNERLSKELLTSRIRNSVKTFVRFLSKERADDQDIVQIFHGRSLDISSKIISQAFGRMGVQRRLSRKPSHESDVIHDGQSDNARDFQEEHGSETDSESSQSTDEEEIRADAIDIDKFTEICASSDAFRIFMADIRELAFPTFTSKLRSLSTYTMRTWKDPSLYSKVEELLCELEYSRPSRMDMVVDKPNWCDRAKVVFESYYGEEGDWWPFDPPRTLLKPHEARVSWKCACGRTRRIAVPRRLAKRLIRVVQSFQKQAPPERLNPHDKSTQRLPLPAVSSTSTFQQSIPRPSELGGSSSSIRFTSSAQGQPASTGSGVQPRRAGLPTTVGRDQLRNTDARTIFLMTEKGTIIPSQEGLKRSNISSHDKCNQEFFHELKESYWRHRGWLRRIFGIETFSHCDFYRFYMYDVDRYEIQAEELPDQNSTSYYYLPRYTPPQISKEEFRDRFWRCARSCSCDSITAVERIPQLKANVSGSRHNPTFWGIVARQRRYHLRVWIYCGIAALPLIPSIWFFFMWIKPGDLKDDAAIANRRDNLSNAFIPLGISIALFMAVLTITQ